jgi:hypothetical protein
MSAALSIGSIVLRVDDLELEARFWTAALGYLRREEDSDDFALLYPPDRVGTNLALDLHAAAARVPPRIHLDLYATDQAAEVRRLVELGATEVPVGQATGGRRLRHS